MPRPMHAPLTDQRIRTATPQDAPIDLRDGELRGLILTVLPSGKRQWTIRYRARDEQKNAVVQRRAVLGIFPGLSIAEARRAGRKMLSDIDAGKDPVAVRAAAEAVRTDTVRALAREYLEEHARPKKRSADEDERILDRDVLPSWGHRSVKEISRRDVKDILKRIIRRGSPIMANRTLEIIRKMLNYGVQEEWIDANPAARLPKPGVEKSRERVLTDDEIRRLWRLLTHVPETHQKQAPGRPRAADPEDDPFCPLSPALAAAQKIRLLTAQRGGEVIKMKWADLDLTAGWWTISAADSKNGKAHRVPLTKDAIAIIEAQEPDEDKRGEHVFTGRGGAVPMQRMKKAGAACARALRFDFRGHDLRRSAATRMTAAGIPSAHVSHVLNHVQGGPKATRIYDRHDYDAEKRRALETWARDLSAILSNRPQAGAVLQMRRG